MMRRLFLLAGLCSLMLACQHSPQKNYYYLTPQLATEQLTTERRGTEQAATDKTNNTTQLIGIGPVEIADYLNRLQIIDSQTNNTLNMADNAYWAEPFDKSIARVTALNLTQLNSTRSFVDFPWRSDSKPRYSLRLRVDNLARSAGKASINATWELMDNDTKKSLLRRHFVKTLAANSGAKALAQVYSQLLADLATEVDTELRKIP